MIVFFINFMFGGGYELVLVCDVWIVEEFV